MLEDTHLKILLELFGMAPSDATFLRYSQNYVYSCKSGGRQCILRITCDRHRSQKQVEAELDWLMFLGGRGIDVCLPEKSRHHRLCEKVVIGDREYLVTCFQHAPGRKIVSGDMNASLYLEIGKLMGRMHAATIESARLPGKAIERPAWHESRLLNEDMERYLPPANADFVKAVRNLVDEVKRTPVTRNNFGLIHGDVSFGNCFLDEGRLWIFDFDNCEYGYFLQDVAVTVYDSILCQLLNRAPAGELDARVRERWGAFHEGYSSVRAMEGFSQERLQKFLVLREAIIYIHYHRILDMGNLSPEFRQGMDLMRQNVESGVTQAKIWSG